jgi:hypothetical protein
MSSAQYPLRQSGIYHSRPTLDPSIENLTAIVCSATSISRFQAIRALLDTADCWSKIYALSCSPSFKEMLACFTDQQLARIQHVSIDLRSSAAEISPPPTYSTTPTSLPQLPKAQWTPAPQPTSSTPTSPPFNQPPRLPLTYRPLPQMHPSLNRRQKLRHAHRLRAHPACRI